MTNTFAWPCRDCGEFNVVNLKDRSAAEFRCHFCMKPLQTYPTLEPLPRVRLTDEWLGDEVVKPLFESVRTDG